MTRRAIYIPGLVHENPIPVACRNGPQLMTGLIAPLNPGTREIPEQVDDKIANIFSHIGAILDAADATWDDITKLNFYVTDIAIRPAINVAWLERFPDEATRPARHTQVLDVRGGIGCDFTAYIAG